MGFVLSYISIGMAGEDLFKAFFLAKQHGKGNVPRHFRPCLLTG